MLDAVDYQKDQNCFRRVHHRARDQGDVCDVAPAVLHVRDVPQGAGRPGLHQEPGPRPLPRVQRQGQGAGPGQIHVPEVPVSTRVPFRG